MRKYYLFDRGFYHPQGNYNITIQSNKVTKDSINNPMFTEGFFSTPKLPWEVRYDNGYPNIIYDHVDKLYKLYYTMIIYDPVSEAADKATRAITKYKPMPNRLTATGYAQSEDGIHWIKPNLGLEEFNGSKDNNILMLYAHGTGVFLDEEETDPTKRFKMITLVDLSEKEHYLASSFSSDGIHWSELIPWPKNNINGDTHNFPFRDKIDGKYKAISRKWQNGQRISVISESTDFINWTNPQEIIRGIGFGNQVYSMPVFQSCNAYIGLASIFHEGDASLENFDTVDCHLTYATSNPTKFNFVDDNLSPFIENGKGKYPNGEFDCCCIYAATPIEIDNKLCFYYMGGNGQHTNFRETSFGRAFLEKDKFAYATNRDGSKDGKIVSTQVEFTGSKLRLLCEIDSPDHIKVGLYSHWDEKPYPGFSFEDCKIKKSESNCDWYSVEFPASPSTLPADKKIHIIIKLNKGKIFAIEGDFQHTSTVY